MKQAMKVLKVLIPLTVFVILIAVVLLQIRKPYFEKMTIEAGQELFDPTYFFENYDAGAEYVTAPEDISLNHVGINNVKIKLNGLIYNVKLEVVDTQKPNVKVKDEVVAWISEPLKPEDFFEVCEDATDLSFEFDKELDYYSFGSTQVNIIVTDEGGNSVEVSTMLVVSKDTEPPAIYGVRDRIVALNSTIAYRDEVFASDNSGVVELEIDSSAMNVKEEGVYPITYKAKDGHGNERVITVNFTVVYVEESKVAQDVIDNYFEEIYNSITTESMTKREKAWAIYQFVTTNLNFIPMTDHTDWEQNAYKGLKEGKGDCYTYYAASRKLFTLAGIENMCVERQHEVRHYWNLINCGEGWYHYDACPREGYPEDIFMWTDAQALDYSNNVRYGHLWFDSSKYPATPK